MLFALPATGFGQTFRGGINGTVTDQSGAVVAGAEVTAVETATSATFKAVSSSAGEFAFTNLALGDYSVTVSAAGFSTVTVNKVTVSASVSYTLPVKLGVAGAATNVEVTANALSVDTVTDVQATAIPEIVVQNLPSGGRDFTQMVGQITGFAGLSVSGGGTGTSSVNGTRTNSVNWELEGTDNNDLWWNIQAINQGGVTDLAGVLLPIDAIENFSFTSAGTTEIGRNSGGTVNVTIKSGTNALHGSAYYFNHNEFFQADNPFESAKPAARDQHYGFSVGGPIRRDKTFFFLSGEHEAFLIGAGTSATEPSTAYQTIAESVLGFYGVPVNPVATNLLNGNGTLAGLWPASALNGPANTLNYRATGNILGHSFNGVAKFDEQLTDKDHIAFSWFIGQGNQTAPTTSELTPYFEVAPVHVQNYSLVYNRLLTTSIANQLSAGVSYYNQTFSDADTNFDPIGLGLNTGVTSPSLRGAPHLVIGPTTASAGTVASGSGFDPLGVTTPSGRNDITGHLDEDLTWTKGAHQFHFGGEFRQAQVDDFNQPGQRGSIYFDGTQGPWYTTATPCAALATTNQGVALPASITTDPNALYLADFLAGCFDPSQTANVLGDPKRQVFVNTAALYAQDAWQVTKKLSLNYGLRYDYQGPPHSAYPNLSIFDPSLASGLAVAGQDVANIYPKYWKGFSPRVGFAYQLGSTDRTVLRGGYGLYEDSIFLKEILQGTEVQNMSVFGPEFNPAGINEVAQAGGINAVIQSGQPIFETYAQALAGVGVVKLSTFDQKFRPSYTQTIDLNLQHSFTSSVVWQVGYVGTLGTHLTGMSDINPGALNSLNTPVPYNSTTCPAQYSGASPTSAGNNLQCSRPYFSQFPNFSVIDEMRSNLGSNYNSLQTTLRLQNWRQLSAQLGYTWGHGLDYETGNVPYMPQNPLDEGAEYGNSDYDVRQTLTGYADYQVPQFRGPVPLTKGWELNSGFSFHGGMPYTVTSNSNPSGNGESADRAVQVLANPEAGVSHAIVGGAVQWFSGSAFADAPQGTYSPTRRGQNYNPGYADMDVAVIKNTPIRDRVSAQLRADLFNIFNHANLAPVGLPFASEAGRIGSTIGPYLGSPSIGPGEPFCVQWSLKILF